ncbi:SDR family NAD(P)-dependent oxidoreductase [Candidatus Uhrbacteria bacterium]|nr:SDR family NAD(P)-dependent oxidoreductase [Candidatus Uhrbacteria bacterium]
MDEEFNKQTVLITGASGFIGSHLTRRLTQLGADVHILVRNDSNPWRIADVVGKGITVWKAEITESDKIKDYLKRICPKRVFHLAAIVNPERSLENIEKIIDVNIKGTVALIKALQDIPLECFVNVGTCEEYGDNAAPFNETQRESAVSPYSASKISATHFCQMIHKVAAIPVVTVRPFLTYGPFQLSNLLIPALIRFCLNNEKEFRMTSGEQTREFNFVGDIVEGMLKASLCKELVGEIINIGNGTEYKVIDVARMIVKLMNSPLELNRSLSHRKGEVFHFYSATDKYLRLLKPSSFTSLEDGLKITIEWYAKNWDHLPTFAKKIS